MSEVVLRCRNCGTTQSSLGECQTCHASEVRYFCPNHDPGHWLDGPRCAACGAQARGEGDPWATGGRRPPAAQAGERRGAEVERQADLQDLKRRLEGQELLVRGLLTHLAMTSPDAFGAVVGGIVTSGKVPDEVAQDVTALVEEIAASLR